MLENDVIKKGNDFLKEATKRDAKPEDVDKAISEFVFAIRKECTYEMALVMSTW